jgi:hypothetical protein
MLRGKDDKGIWRTLMERPIFYYSDVPPLSIVTESVTLRDNQEYEIVLMDSFGDGQDFDFADSMVLEIWNKEQVLLYIDDFSGSDMYHSSFDFTLGTPATVAPTQTTSPSVSMTPTSAPTEQRLFISLVMEVGGFPQNLGFRLEVLDDDREGGIFDGTDMGQYTLLHVVYPGNFAPEVEGARIKVEIPLKGESTITQIYRFTMTSNEGFGLSGGSYEVWLGPAMTGEFLFGGKDFYYEETHTFSIEPGSLALEDSPTEVPGIPSIIFSDEDAASMSSASSVAITLCFFLLGAWVPVWFL